MSMKSFEKLTYKGHYTQVTCIKEQRFNFRKLAKQKCRWGGWSF
jgi:hypothetical protein